MLLTSIRGKLNVVIVNAVDFNVVIVNAVDFNLREAECSDSQCCRLQFEES